MNVALDNPLGAVEMVDQRFEVKIKSRIKLLGRQIRETFAHMVMRRRTHTAGQERFAARSSSPRQELNEVYITSTFRL